jgi:uncharacterized protein YjbJ (UPF0337 family)
MTQVGMYLALRESVRRMDGARSRGSYRMSDKDRSDRGTENRAEGKIDELKGKARKNVGEARGDTSQQLKGKGEELKGKGQQKLGEMQEDSARDENR